MTFVAIRQRLLPGASEAYIRAHEQIPQGLVEAQRVAGLRRWLIFEDGLDIVHVAESEDFDKSIRQLARHPADISWQREMDQHKQPVDDSGSPDRRLRLIYSRDLWLPADGGVNREA